jgi:4-hydroxybenzoate polyprenyltransferase
MGAIDAARVARPKWRAYLLLSRVSNLPTVWSNVLAATVAAGARAASPSLAHLAAASSLFYVGGMFLNDASDRHFDAMHRAERPIPARDVSAFEATAIGVALLAVGEAWLLAAGFERALAWGAALAAAIVLYDLWHKGNPVGPILMGGCRALVYMVAAAGVSVDGPTRTGTAAALMAAYVAGVTFVAKHADRRTGWTIPWLIAGISIVDAAVVVWAGGGAALAFLAATGFVLTLVLQRVVPGT